MNKIKTAYEKLLKEIDMLKFQKRPKQISLLKKYDRGLKEWYIHHNEIIIIDSRIVELKAKVQVFIERCRDEFEIIRKFKNVKYQGVHKYPFKELDERITDLKEVLDLSEREGK